MMFSKFKSIAMCGVLALCVTACGIFTLQAKDMIGQPAPHARLMLFDGTEIPLSAQQGRYSAIVFWATWCPKSRKMITRYEELARHYSRRDDVDFFAVSVDKNEDFGKLKDRIKAQDLKTMTHIFSGNDSQDEAFLSFKGNSVPYLVFIGPNGKILAVDDDFDSFEESLKIALGS